MKKRQKREEKIVRGRKRNGKVVPTPVIFVSLHAFIPIVLKHVQFNICYQTQDRKAQKATLKQINMVFGELFSPTFE